MHRWAIGIDVGGTNLKLGAVNASGQVLQHRLFPLTDKSPQATFDLITREVQSLRKSISGDLVGLGCGLPGIVDFQNGVVCQSPNLPLWHDVAAREGIARRVNLPVVIDNDANMWALGELLFGAGKGRQYFVLLTLGSGIGSGIIVDGKLYRGERGFAGEVGHIVVEADGPVHEGGGRGNWELYAASRAFRIFTERLPEAERKAWLARVGGRDNLTPEYVSALAKQGDATALMLWRHFGRYFGIGLHSLINVLGMTCFIVGGGIAKSWDLFMHAAREEITSRSYPQNVATLEILPTACGEHAGIIGAAASALKAL